MTLLQTDFDIDELTVYGFRFGYEGLADRKQGAACPPTLGTLTSAFDWGMRPCTLVWQAKPTRSLVPGVAD